MSPNVPFIDLAIMIQKRHRGYQPHAPAPTVHHQPSPSPPCSRRREELCLRRPRFPPPSKAGTRSCQKEAGLDSSSTTGCPPHPNISGEKVRAGNGGPRGQASAGCQVHQATRPKRCSPCCTPTPIHPSLPSPESRFLESHKVLPATGLLLVPLPLPQVSSPQIVPVAGSLPSDLYTQSSPAQRGLP